MKKKEIKILKYIPIFLFLGLLVFNFVHIYLLDQPVCGCVIVYKSQFLGNEVLNLGLIYFMYLVSTKSKLCFYNKVSIIGLLTITLLNIIAITTPINFTFYNSIVTQISMILIAMLSIYLFRKKI